MSRPQRNTKRPKWQEEEEEEDSRQKGRGGKLPAKRDEKKGELVSPQSAKGESPAAGDERRPKHFGDEAGGTVLPIPSKSLNAESPGTAASKGTASSKHESEESAEEGEDEDGIEGEEDKEEEAAGAETDGEGRGEEEGEDEEQEDEELKEEADEQEQEDEDEEEDEEEEEEEEESSEDPVKTVAATSGLEASSQSAQSGSKTLVQVPHGAAPATAAATPRPADAAAALKAASPASAAFKAGQANPSTSAAPASPAITAMAAMAAAAALMAEARKKITPQTVEENKATAPAVLAAAPTAVIPATTSQAVIQKLPPPSGVAGSGLLPVGWAAQGIAAMAGLSAHQMALHNWAHMAGAPIPVAPSITAEPKVQPSAGVLPASSVPVNWSAIQQYASLGIAPVPAVKGTAVPASPALAQQQAAHHALAQQAQFVKQHKVPNPPTHVSLATPPASNAAAGAAARVGVSPVPRAPVVQPLPQVQRAQLQRDATAALERDEKRQKTSVSAIGPRKLVMWTGVDDALLKSSIQGGMSLCDIAAHIPFTSEFSVRDLEVRWRALLYDPVMSMEVAVELAALQGGKRVNVPHKRKSATSSDLTQTSRDSHRASLLPATASVLLQQGVTADKVSNNITALEDRVTAASAVRSSTVCLAAVDGVKSHYLIFKSLIVLGRKPRQGGGMAEVDVDLSLEGDASLVSRQQALIRRDMRGIWWLENVGKGCVYVNGTPVLRLTSCELPCKVLLVIGGIRLTFDKA